MMVHIRAQSGTKRTQLFDSAEHTVVVLQKSGTGLARLAP